MEVRPTVFQPPLGQMSTVTKNTNKYLVDTGSGALLHWDAKTKKTKSVSCQKDEQEISFVGDRVCVVRRHNADFDIQGAYVTQMSHEHAKLLQPVTGILGLLPPKTGGTCKHPAFNTYGVAKALNCPAYYNVNLTLDSNARGHLEYKCSAEKIDGIKMVDPKETPYLNTCIHHAILQGGSRDTSHQDTLLDTGWPGSVCTTTEGERHEVKCTTPHDCTNGVTPRVCQHDTFVGKNVTMQFSDTGGTTSVHRVAADEVNDVQVRII